MNTRQVLEALINWVNGLIQEEWGSTKDGWSHRVVAYHMIHNHLVSMANIMQIQEVSNAKPN